MRVYALPNFELGDDVNRVLIVPGLNNSGPGHWQTVWENQLSCAQRIDIADWSTPNLAAWIVAIETAIDNFAPTHIVAHSFGTLASAIVVEKIAVEKIAMKHTAIPNRFDKHTAAKTKSASALRGLFFVAPADPDKFQVRHLLPASALPVRGILVGSLSDPWLSWNGAQALAAQWHLDVECAGDVGHINVQSGHGEWQDGWQSFQALFETSDQRAQARTANSF